MEIASKSPPYEGGEKGWLLIDSVGWHGQTHLSVQSVAICRKHGQTKFVHATTQVGKKVTEGHTSRLRTTL